MATYPIKMLRDENQEPFVPMVSADSIYMNDGKSFEEKLAGKIGVENLAEGTGINIETKGDITTISVDFGASDNIIDNLDTTVAGQGPLDARQGNVLKNMIPAIVDNLNSADASKTLSANQGRILKDMSVPTGGATGQVLKKASNNDHELEWGDAADPNAIVGDGSIMKIIELTYAEYKTLESNGGLREDTEYHITDVDNGATTYITEEKIKQMIDEKVIAKIYDRYITPTNDFLGEKRIYRCRIVTYDSMNNSTLIIPTLIDPDNVEYAWIDPSNSYFISGAGTADMRSLPINANFYIDTTDACQISATYDKGNVHIMSNSGWGTGWMKVVTVRFTYTNDPNEN